MEKSAYTIGIADDHAGMRAVLKFILTYLKFEVLIEAEDGEDLIRQISNTENKPTLCFVDGNMPRLDGSGTVLRLKKMYPSINVIAHTNCREKGQEMLKFGADLYLPKGCKVGDIFDGIIKLENHKAIKD